MHLADQSQHYSAPALSRQIFSEADYPLPRTQLCKVERKHDLIIRDPMESSTWMNTQAFGELTAMPICNVSQSIGVRKTNVKGHSHISQTQLHNKHLQLFNNMNVGLIHRRKLLLAVLGIRSQC